MVMLFLSQPGLWHQDLALVELGNYFSYSIFLARITGYRTDDSRSSEVEIGRGEKASMGGGIEERWLTQVRVSRGDEANMDRGE